MSDETRQKTLAAIKELVAIGERALGDAPPSEPIEWPELPAFMMATALSPHDKLNARGEISIGEASLVSRLLVLAYQFGIAKGLSAKAPTVQEYISAEAAKDPAHLREIAITLYASVQKPPASDAEAFQLWNLLTSDALWRLVSGKYETGGK